ncbi:MAG: hypothetical protein O2816_03365 [Planctomycetota bacterium]|nr:hypothetical protein [Planctomycetota bacterium]
MLKSILDGSGPAGEFGEVLETMGWGATLQAAFDFGALPADAMDEFKEALEGQIGLSSAQAKLADRIEFVTARLMAGSDLHLEANVDCRDADTAEELESILKELQEKFAEMSGVPAPALDLLVRIRVNSSGKRVTLEVRVTTSNVESLFR